MASKMLLLFLAMLSFGMLCGSRKMKERFDWDINQPLLHLSVTYPAKLMRGLSPQSMMNEQFLSQYIDVQSTKILVRGFNFSFNPTHEAIYGYANSTGHYNGLIGAIQRNESNTANLVVRYDSLAYEPGYTIPFPMSDTPRIHATIVLKGSRTKGEDILYFVNNFPPFIWLYFFAVLAMCTILILAIRNLLGDENEDNDISFTSTLKDTLSIWERYNMLAFDQEIPIGGKFISLTILWTSIVIGLYFGLHQLLYNTLSADFVISSPNKTIQTFDDLMYDPDFKNESILVGNHLNMYRVLKESLSGTKANQLLKMILEDKRGEIISTLEDESVTDYLAGLSKRIMSGKAVFIESSYYFELFLSALCVINREDLSKLYLSRDVIAPSPLAILLSKATPIRTTNYLRYRMLLSGESGIQVGLLRNIEPAMLEKFLQKSPNLDSMRCKDRFFGKSIKESESEEYDALTINAFEFMTQIIASIFTLACFVLIIECNVEFLVKVTNKLKINPHLPRLRSAWKRLRAHIRTKYKKKNKIADKNQDKIEDKIKDKK